jgi:predicted dehydrogenase
MDVIRYGVLSTAQIARNAHIPAAQEATNSEIVALSSRSKVKADKWAAELGIPKAYGSYDQLLADPEVDAVINPLPNSMHCEWTVKAAEAGKHILCEKPLAVTVDEAQRMIDAAQANDVLLMEGFTQHFLPHLEYARQVLDAGEIGDLRLLRAELVYTLRDWENDSRAQADLAGGALWDAGCYCVNTIRSVVRSEPIEVQALQTMHPEAGVDATFTGLLLFPGGVTAFMCTSMEMPFRGSCEIVGTLGRIDVPSLFGGDKVVVTAGGEERVITFEPTNRFARQMAHFSGCILSGRPVKRPPVDGLRNTAALVALKRSAETGRTVAL